MESGKGRLVLNMDDMEGEVEEEWRVKEIFKGTSLEQLPLRAIKLLKSDGWTGKFEDFSIFFIKLGKDP